MSEALRERVLAAVENWSTSKKRARRLAEIREMVDAAIAPDAAFELTEQVAVKVLGLSAQELLQEELQLHADRADRLDADGKPPREWACPRCGGVTATFARRRTRTIESSVGELKFKRSVYDCCGRSTRGKPGKGHVFSPADAAIGIREGQNLSPWQERLTSEFGAELPFARARMLLAKTVEVACATSTVHEVTIEAGRVAEEEMLARSKQIRECPPDVQLLPDPMTRDDIAIIQIDGAMCPVHPDAARDDDGAADGADDPADGDSLSRKPPGRPDTRHREVKSVAIYKQRDHIVKPPTRSGKPGRGHVRRCFTRSRICHWLAFAWLLYTLALQLGVRRAKQVVILGDGAEWIGWIATKFFAGATRILDFWHAMEHIARAGHAALGVGTPEFKSWYRRQRTRLRAGKAHDVIAAVRALAGKGASAGLREIVREEVGYLSKRVAQMDYPRFESQGLPIGSGLIEGHNRHIVKNRLDAGGMRWHPEHANRLLSLITERRNDQSAARAA